MIDWAKDDLALAHDLLTEAGMPRGDDHGFHSVAVRVGLLIDERDSLKDELEQTRQRADDLQDEVYEWMNAEEAKDT